MKTYDYFVGADSDDRKVRRSGKVGQRDSVSKYAGWSPGTDVKGEIS